jgi:hypothetical protein
MEHKGLSAGMISAKDGENGVKISWQAEKLDGVSLKLETMCQDQQDSQGP